MTFFGFLFRKNDKELIEKQFCKDTEWAKLKNIYKTKNKGGNSEKIKK